MGKNINKFALFQEEENSYQLNQNLLQKELLSYLKAQVQHKKVLDVTQKVQKDLISPKGDGAIQIFPQCPPKSHQSRLAFLDKKQGLHGVENLMATHILDLQTFLKGFTTW